jgi:hypothetical protein
LQGSPIPLENGWRLGKNGSLQRSGHRRTA